MKNITLEELFNKRNVSALKNMASACRIKGYTKMKKAELVDACIETVQREGFFEEYILILSPEAWKFYKKIAESNNGLKCNANPMKYAFSEKLGFLYVEKCKDGFWFMSPDEIKKKYNELIKSGFFDVKEFADLIHQYAQAAVNLYGAISQEELVEIFNFQNEQQTDADTNFKVYNKHIYLDYDYCLWGKYIVHKDLEENDFEDAKDLICDTIGKPRYIPNKSEFLRYANWSYYENTKQLAALSRFLINKCGVSNYTANKLIFDLHWKFADEIPFQNYFDVLEKYNVIIEENQLNELVLLITDCYNNTRLWSNKGYTPAELARLSKMPKAKSQKIGRNDPCPCGSGKKYKKCCGR